jgi:uncharacterized protein Usg
MPLTSWENPFNKVPPVTAEGTIILPNQTELVDVDFIRAQQKMLLPVMEHMHGRAIAIMRASEHVALLPTNEVIGVKVYYRLPDAGHVINTYYHEFDDHAVAVPLSNRKREPLAIENTFSVQERGPGVFKPDNFAATQKGHMAMISLTKDELDDDDVTRQAIVYPRTTEFLIHWLDKLDGPVHDVSVGPRGRLIRHISPAFVGRLAN